MAMTVFMTKFAKVMFLHLSFCSHGGWSASGEGGSLHPGGCWQTAPDRILRDTVNERAVRILLECILVVQLFVFLGGIFLDSCVHDIDLCLCVCRRGIPGQLGA